VKYKNTALVIISGVLTWIAFVSGCSAALPPAQFDVTSLTIKPKQVTIGEPASIIVQVGNSGGSTGIYSATLSVNGTKVDSKTVSLSPGATDTVTFALSEDKAGTYNITVGGSNLILTVNPKMVSKPVEVGYDDGQANDYLGVDKPCTGYLISYDPPSIPFTIDTVRIFGLIYGGHGFMIKDIEVQIWDKDKKVVGSAIADKGAFPLLAYLPSDIEKQGAWANVRIPDTKVTGPFYVHVYTGVTTGQGFRMGADDEMGNTHSDVTIRDSGGSDSVASSWPYPSSRWFGDKSRVNWMVRASGTAWITEQ
jgi:hypothetical protein